MYAAGEYRRASLTFRTAAAQAERDGSGRQAALNWNNAGGAALARLDFREALPDFLKARQIAAAPGLRSALRSTLNNLAGLYLQMGDAEASVQVAREALALVDLHDDAATSSRLRYQLAIALAQLHRFAEAAPVYRQAIVETLDRDEFETAARMLGSFGSDCLEAGYIDEAESALSEGLRLVRVHHLDASANILRALAKLKDRRGDHRSAAALFDAAVGAPAGITPRWVIYADRGEFRLRHDDLHGALADFRAARQIASRMRADIVPADQDRVFLESGLSRVATGLVDAGNRLASRTSDASLLRETFDQAEQDRMWSLRTLVATPNDWRSRLPDSYWDLLGHYQTVERALVANPTAELKRQAASLEMQLQQLEATASNGFPDGPEEAQSALAHARKVLGADSVLFSFHVSRSQSWLWAVDRRGVAVYPIAGSETLRSAVAEFVCAVRDGNSQASTLGQQMYQRLFGNADPRYLAHKRWLLELDGPLFDIPFGALAAGLRKGQHDPAYLIESRELETIPGALMLESRTPFGRGSFLGIGDPIYNGADPRYRGSRIRQEIVLPRLPATATELEACARTWNPSKSQVLTGSDAGLASVRAALNSRPSVIHFATHVVTARGSYASGLIALGLDKNGTMGLLGPAEIVARPLSPGLVVLSGCHSGQGEALPGSGLMGLTRAWLGAGAKAVLATRWDVSDELGSTVMVAFYRALRGHPERGPAYALQQAQSWLRESQGPGSSPSVWAAYFVMGRE